MSDNCAVVARPDENFNRMLRRFTLKRKLSGIDAELTKRRFGQSRGAARRAKNIAAAVRRVRADRRRAKFAERQERLNWR